MLGRVLGIKNKFFFPLGYKFITGTMTIAECNANQKIIPVDVVMNGYLANMKVQPTYGDISLGSYNTGSGSYGGFFSTKVNTWSMCNYDMNKLLPKKILKGDGLQSVTAWLEKVGN